jgi:hypothetical protein
MSLFSCGNIEGKKRSFRLSTQHPVESHELTRFPPPSSGPLRYFTSVQYRNVFSAPSVRRQITILLGFDRTSAGHRCSSVNSSIICQFFHDQKAIAARPTLVQRCAGIQDLAGVKTTAPKRRSYLNAFVYTKAHDLSSSIRPMVRI